MVCDYVAGLAAAASAHSLQRAGNAKPNTEDVVAVVRKDAARAGRARELITANEETKRSLKEFEPDSAQLEKL